MSGPVLVVGLGGLGCPAAVTLAARGVSLTLLDADTVEPTNLARQMLYGERDLGAPKVEAAARALRERFPSVPVTPLVGRFDRSDATRALVRSHAVVLDGTDDFPTRFAANDLCVDEGRPLVHGAALGWRGQLLTIRPGTTPCLRCVFEGEPPGRAPTCAEAGVVSPLVGLVGRWMAEAALDLLSGRTPRSAGAMRVHEGLTGRDRFAEVGRDPACSACGRPAREEARL